MFFGKRQAAEMAKGVGKFIDEQQLTLEERLQYQEKLLSIMGPFVTVQRIIITFVMIHWGRLVFSLC